MYNGRIRLLTSYQLDQHSWCTSSMCIVIIVVVAVFVFVVVVVIIIIVVVVVIGFFSDAVHYNIILSAVLLGHSTVWSTAHQCSG